MQRALIAISLRESLMASRIQRRVGTRLAAGFPPGTVRAPLDAYGSTSETAERHIFQRGTLSVFSASGFQVGFRPLKSETQVAPIVSMTGVLWENPENDDFRCIGQR